MIEYQKIKDDNFKIIIKLASVGMNFYPFGSRYFGYFKEDSDYDFFCSDSDEFQDLMYALGFQIVNRPIEYNDLNTIEVFYKDRINVMSVRSIKARLTVQKTIYGKEERPPKGDKDWWNRKYCELFPDQFQMPKVEELHPYEA